MRAGAGKGPATKEDMEGLCSLVVLFSETAFIVMVPSMPGRSQVQDLVSHSSYRACHQPGLPLSLGVMVHLLTAMEQLFMAHRLVKKHMLHVGLHSQL